MNGNQYIVAGMKMLRTGCHALPVLTACAECPYEKYCNITVKELDEMAEEYEWGDE